MNLLFANDRRGALPQSWYAATANEAPRFRALDGDTRADVCVVGGGYTGLSAARHMARAGLDVVVLEAHRMGFGASGRNGGQVGSGQRIDQTALEEMLGRDDAHALWQMGEDAKALVRDLIETEGMARCAFRPGLVHADRSRRDVARSHAAAEKLARDYGYDSIEPLDREGLRAIVGSDAYKGGVIDRGAGHIHPLNFALGLAGAADAAGARLFEGTQATAIDHGPGSVVVTPRGRVEADHIVLACNGYLGDLDGQVAQRVMPINNFIIATEPLGAAAADILAEPVAVADSRFVVNYFRLSEDNRLLFGGGESYGYRFPADIAAKVRRPMLEIFPQLRAARIDYAWGGTLAITRTRLPCFHRSRRNVLSASGYSGHGVALATLAGRIVAEAVAGQAGRFDLMARLPMPRFPGGPRLRTPLLALAMSWFALRDRLGI
ncbi:FAD-dependent oxidoreductase [Rhodobacteraceae bacterium WD3A24]|nr:FAD-dependent oxidoreductase [Rhodobacteraceae bacterium WD3A24]